MSDTKPTPLSRPEKIPMSRSGMVVTDWKTVERFKRLIEFTDRTVSDNFRDQALNALDEHLGRKVA